MATVRPFRGLRYSDAAGAISTLVAPPYDVISESQREKYADKNFHNVVNLTLPEHGVDDRSKYIKYARSAARLEEWRRENFLSLDDQPSFYRYTQRFLIPGNEIVCERTKLITTIKVEPYTNGVILPHEQTFPKHKEDRMRLLEATRSHLECIFGLFEDDDKSIHTLITGSPTSAIHSFVTDEDGITHIFERILDKTTCDNIVNALAKKKVWIADGHHRYETSLAFRERHGEQKELIAEDFMMMALCSISDPGLVLLPTHRILKQMPITSTELQTRLSQYFTVTTCANEKLMETISQTNGCAFGIALKDGKGLIAESQDRTTLASKIESPGGDDLKKLDVSILHGLIFAKILSLTGHDFFDYTRNEQEALDAIVNGAPAAFLMNPPSVEDMRNIASAGDFMPQKSTYYYPKLLSGLVMWSLKDFEP